jgi:hypothetical protein
MTEVDRLWSTSVRSKSRRVARVGPQGPEGPILRSTSYQPRCPPCLDQIWALPPGSFLDPPPSWSSSHKGRGVIRQLHGALQQLLASSFNLDESGAIVRMLAPKAPRAPRAPKRHRRAAAVQCWVTWVALEGVLAGQLTIYSCSVPHPSSMRELFVLETPPQLAFLQRPVSASAALLDSTNTCAEYRVP